MLEILANNNIFMPRTFSFAMIRLNEESELNEACLTYYLRHMQITAILSENNLTSHDIIK
jgi:hypothetical protein